RRRRRCPSRRPRSRRRPSRGRGRPTTAARSPRVPAPQGRARHRARRAGRSRASLPTVAAEDDQVVKLALVRQAVLIVNPFASGVTEQTLADVEAALGRHAAVRTLLTERPRHATELAEQVVREGCDAIFVFSGDGGFNEALNGVSGDVALGFIPGGGTSVLPRALGLGRDPVDAARRLGDALAAGRTRRLSL